MSGTPVRFTSSVARVAESSEVEMQRKAGRSRRWWPTGRTLFLVDAENLAGTGRPAAGALVAAAKGLAEAMPVGPADHIVVGVAHNSVLGAGLAWPRARLVVGSGPDGADLALLRNAQAQDLASRYDRVVVASGDGAFAPLVAELGSLGVQAVVVSPAGSCSRRLRLAARAVVVLDAADGTPIPPHPTGTEARRAA